MVATPTIPVAGPDLAVIHLTCRLRFTGSVREEKKEQPISTADPELASSWMCCKYVIRHRVAIVGSGA